MMVNLRKLYVIAYYTFREILKSKILVNVAILGLGLMLVTYVAFSFTYGEASRVALDFGLGMLSLSSVGIAIFIGVGLLSKEIENRTVYMIISRPVPRFIFILGKILGLIAILIVNILLLSALTLSLYFFTGGNIDSLIAWSIFFTMLEAIIVLLVVSTVSLLSTPTMSVLATIMVYMSGNAVSEAKLTAFAKNAPVLMDILDVYHFILPAFYKLNIKDFIIYKQTLPMDYLLGSTVYGILYAVFLCLLSIIIFERKNLD